MSLPTRICLTHEASARVRFARGMGAKEYSLRLYGIVDGESCSRRGFDLFEIAQAWRTAGVRLIQYRDKPASVGQVLANAMRLREMFPVGEAFLILNDYPELVAGSGFDGVHIGQGDAGVAEARAAVGPERIIGVSTHSADQALSAGESDADYVAIGPVFATSTKLDAEPVVGLCGLQAARAVVRKPLVAIGGIVLGRVREVRGGGVDAVAVISGLLPEEAGAAAFTRSAQDFLLALK